MAIGLWNTLYFKQLSYVTISLFGVTENLNHKEQIWKILYVHFHIHLI
jgi:hypothetical protein